MAYLCLKSYLPYDPETARDLPLVVNTITTISKCKFYSMDSIEVRANHIFSYLNKRTTNGFGRGTWFQTSSFIKFILSPTNSLKLFIVHFYHITYGYYISTNRLQKNILIEFTFENSTLTIFINKLISTVCFTAIFLIPFVTNWLQSKYDWRRISTEIT